MEYIIPIGIIIIILLFVIVTYNGLVQAKNKVKANWAQVDVQMKQRADLIPNLVETVKGYAKHESETMQAVIAARNAYLNASVPKDMMQASDEMTKALTKVFALSEDYPELKSNTNFMSLQNQLSDIEKKIAFARQFYNDSVYVYTNKLEMFPSRFIATMFGFKPYAYLEIDDKDKNVPHVKF